MLGDVAAGLRHSSRAGEFVARRLHVGAAMKRVQLCSRVRWVVVCDGVLERARRAATRSSRRKATNDEAGQTLEARSANV